MTDLKADKVNLTQALATATTERSDAWTTWSGKKAAAATALSEADAEMNGVKVLREGVTTANTQLVEAQGTEDSKKVEIATK